MNLSFFIYILSPDIVSFLIDRSIPSNSFLKCQILYEFHLELPTHSQVVYKSIFRVYSTISSVPYGTIPMYTFLPHFRCPSYFFLSSLDLKVFQILRHIYTSLRSRFHFNEYLYENRILVTCGSSVISLLSCPSGKRYVFY